MLKSLITTILCTIGIIALADISMAQDGNRIPPAKGQTVQTILVDIQSKVDKIQTLQANLEFDRKDDDGGKKKKKKKKKENQGINPKWPEPADRDIERGPLQISRGIGAYLFLQRKKEKEEFIANSTVLWKHDIDDKEARRIPASWPVVDTFVKNALLMNVFVAMDSDTIKFLGVENVDGVPCWALEGKSPSRLSMVGVEQTKLKMWIGQNDGIPHVIKVPDEDDTIIRLKDIRLNEPVDQSKYQFSPPEGTEVKNILGF